MGRAKGVLVDTNVLASKKLVILHTIEGNLYVTPVVVLEYLNWALESRNIWLSRGDVERARGYERLMELFPSLLEELGVEVLDQEYSLEELSNAIDLVLRRGVDPGDALNAITTRKMGLKVVTGDRGWLRLRDYVEDVILV